MRRGTAGHTAGEAAGQGCIRREGASGVALEAVQ